MWLVKYIDESLRSNEWFTFVLHVVYIIANRDIWSPTGLFHSDEVKTKDQSETVEAVEQNVQAGLTTEQQGDLTTV